MGLLAPLALALGLLAVPVVLLYLLRLRRHTRLISSTLLWQQVTEDRAANAPWQRLRRNWLLLLQLLLLAALVVALARPFVDSSNLVQGNVIVLLDASASMLSADGEGGGTRFEDAASETSQLIDGLTGTSTMTLIEAGPRPRVLASSTGDRSALQQGLATAQPYAAAADWAAALALANGLAQTVSRPELVLISDGGLPADLPSPAGALRHIPVGSQSENAAITTLALRPAADGQVLLATVTNSGTEPLTTRLDLFLNGDLFDARNLTLESGERRNLTWTELPAASVVEAQIVPGDGSADFLPIDDRAWAVSPAAVDRQVLIVSEGNLFLEQLFRLFPGITVETTGPGGAEPSAAATYDIVIYDSVPVPTALPDTSTLIINPQPVNAVRDDQAAPDAIRVGAMFSDTIATRLADDPLLQFVEWDGVTVQAARDVEAAWLTPLVEAPGGPLLLAGERNGRRTVVLPFDLTASDLPLRIAFPVMMANITGWLSPGQALAEDALAPGEPVSITPDSAATRLEIDGPDGLAWSTDLESGPAAAVYVAGSPGLYALRQIGSDGRELARQRFAVSFDAFAESTIAPELSLTPGEESEPAVNGGLIGQRELWPWLLGAALLLLMLEWWLSHPSRSKRRPLGSR